MNAEERYLDSRDTVISVCASDAAKILLPQVRICKERKNQFGLLKQRRTRAFPPGNKNLAQNVSQSYTHYHYYNYGFFWQILCCASINVFFLFEVWCHVPNRFYMRVFVPVKKSDGAIVFSPGSFSLAKGTPNYVERERYESYQESENVVSFLKKRIVQWGRQILLSAALFRGHVTRKRNWNGEKTLRDFVWRVLNATTVRFDIVQEEIIKKVRRRVILQSLFSHFAFISTCTTLRIINYFYFRFSCVCGNPSAEVLQVFWFPGQKFVVQHGPLL